MVSSVEFSLSFSLVFFFSIVLLEISASIGMDFDEGYFGGAGGNTIHVLTY